MSDSPTPSFGKRLATFRVEQKLSRADLARLAGIAEDQINALEHGKDQPSVVQVAAVAKALALTDQQRTQLAAGLAGPFVRPWRRKARGSEESGERRMAQFDKFTDRARKVLTLAQEEAQRFNHNYIGTEHLLLGLVREGDGVAARVLGNMGVQLPKVRSAVEFVIGRGEGAVVGEIGLTPRAKKVIELAIDEARRLNHHYIGTEHLLLGLVREGEGIAAGVLESLGVNLDKVRAQVMQVVSQGTTPSHDPDFSAKSRRSQVEAPPGYAAPHETPLVPDYASYGAYAESLADFLLSPATSTPRIVGIAARVFNETGAMLRMLQTILTDPAAPPAGRIPTPDAGAWLDLAAMPLARTPAAALAEMVLAQFPASDPPQSAPQRRRHLRRAPLARALRAQRLVAEFRARVGTAAGASRTVVVLEHLDRCTPQALADLFEAMASTLAVPGLVWVVGEDLRMVQARLDVENERRARVDTDAGTEMPARHVVELRPPGTLGVSLRLPTRHKPGPEEIARMDRSQLAHWRPNRPAEPLLAAVDAIVQKREPAATFTETLAGFNDVAGALTPGQADEARRLVLIRTLDDLPASQSAIGEGIDLLVGNPWQMSAFADGFRLTAFVANRMGLLTDPDAQLRPVALAVALRFRWPDVVASIANGASLMSALRKMTLLSVRLKRSAGHGEQTSPSATDIGAALEALADSERGFVEQVVRLNAVSVG